MSYDYKLQQQNVRDQLVPASGTSWFLSQRQVSHRVRDQLVPDNVGIIDYF